VPSLLIKDEKAKDPEKVGDVCNNLSSICWKFKIISSGEKDAISFQNIYFLANPMVLKLFQTLRLSKRCNNLLKSDNSSGYDEIMSKILKACASPITRPLNSIYIYIICQYTEGFLIIV
jgi:hypothetical protein